MNKSWSKKITMCALLLSTVVLAACSNERPSELMKAAKDGNLEAVKAIVDRGGKVAAQSNKGKSALMFAVSEGHKEIVQWLLDHGANVNAVDNYGTSALIVAATAGKHEALKILLDSGANTEVRDESGGAPLVNAVYFGHTDAVKILLEYLALPDTPQLAKQDGEELMMLAAGLGHVEVVTLMAQFGVDVNGRGLKQRTPLMAAAAFDRDDVANVLLEQGADLHIEDEDGNTALAVAQERSSKKVAALLAALLAEQGRN
jgi:uncharacterized protein